MNFKLYNYNKKSLNRVVILGSGGIISSSLQKMLKERRINIMSIGRSKLDLKKENASKKLKFEMDFEWILRESEGFFLWNEN